MRSSSVITAQLNDLAVAFTEPLYQWDEGMKLKIDGIDLPTAYEVQFSNDPDFGTAVTMIGGADGVTIPASVLENGGNVYAYLYLHDEATDGYTSARITIPVYRRPAVEDGEVAEDERTAIAQAITALNSAVEQTAQDANDANASAETAVTARNEAVEASEKVASSHFYISAGGHLMLEQGDVVKDMGVATAYGYALAGGYTGTEAQFAEDVLKSAQYAGNAQVSAQTAEQAKTDAQTARNEAQAYAEYAGAHGTQVTIDADGVVTFSRGLS